MKASVAIIIPTYNQPHALGQTLWSITKWTKSVYRIYVVDNSEQKYAKKISGAVNPDIVVIEAKNNLGWMGGINLGIKSSTEPFVLMMNDDIKILDFDELWLQKLLESFSFRKDLGAVGPSSNAVMGIQNFGVEPAGVHIVTTAISGFCLLTKRSVLNKVGLLDEKLSGGDDLDFSIRVRKAGYIVSARRDVFVYHFGSLTGKSVFGKYWNSQEYAEKHYKELIRKHGLKEFLKTISFVEDFKTPKFIDWERNLMVKYCKGKGLDVGCGGSKVVPDAIGVDITPKGKRGIAGNQLGRKSQADITVKDTKLPFKDGEFDYVHARHVIEHPVDPLAALREWVRVLKKDGLLIIATPDEDKIDGIPLDPTHKHVFTVESFKNLLAVIGKFDDVEIKRRDISFVYVGRKK